MAVVGIDFGTLNCVISQAKRGGIETALNEASGRRTEALVSFSGNQRAMGVAAVSLQSSNYKNTVVTVKRFIGRRWSDPDVQRDIKRCPNAAAFSQMEGDRIGITVQYNDEVLDLTPEDVCSMLIGSLRGTAEFANEGRRVADIVFSVPTFWGDRQRRAFMDAAHIADVPVLGLINDGTATALSYGIWKSASNQFSLDAAEHIMFVDVGFAATQVTVAAFFQGRLKILAAAADPNLGGRDIDWLLAEHFAKEFQDKHGGDVLGNAKAMIKLLSACEKAKQTLTPEGVKFANVNIEFLLNETDFNSRLTIDTFEELVAPLAARLAEPVERAMEMSKLAIGDIKAVEIVGGATRVRAIKKRLGEVMGLDAEKLNYGLSTTLNADEACSRGCALRSAMLSPAYRVKAFDVIDRVAQPVCVSWDAADVSAANGGADDAAADKNDDHEEEGISAAGQNAVVILQAGDEAGAPKRVTFRRSAPFEVRATYEPPADDKKAAPQPLGTFRIAGMPPHDGEDKDLPPRIRVDFVQDDSGLFGVRGADYMQLLPPKKAKTPPPPADDAPKPMDVDGKEGDAEPEAAAAAQKKPEPEAVREYKAVPLTVHATYDGSIGAAAVASARAREQEFAARDRVIRETGELKNAMEAFVYATRDRLSGELRQYASEQEREEAVAALERDEAWIYDEGYDESKEVYEKRLAALKAQCAPIARRHAEAEQRPESEKHLRESLGRLLAVVNSPDAKYEHISEEERETVRSKCAAAEKWLEEALDEQAGRKTYEDPVITAADVDAKSAELNKACMPVVTKPKPKPTPEAKAAEPADGGEGKSSSADAEAKASSGDAEAKSSADGDDSNDVDAEQDAGEGKDTGMDVD